MKPTASTLAVGYLRVSSVGQVEGDGFARQAEAIDRFAAKAGFSIVESYREAGVSGTAELDNRPALTSCLARILSNGVRVVIVEKADRLARDLIEGELILRQFRDAGVRVIEAEGGSDLAAATDVSPTGTLVRQVLGAVAEFEKSALVAKLRASRIRMRRDTGRCEGRKPFGYRSGEAETLATIKRMRRRSPKTGKPCHTFAAIAEHLRAIDAPSRSGRPWTARMTQKIATGK